ncbi:MAG: 5'-nucleotidase C-terminal domain-containing protein [Polyangiaceae bacterium]
MSRRSWPPFAIVALILSLLLAVAGCEDDRPPFQLEGQVRVTFLHTSDIHSRLYPYDLQIGQVDANLGLGEVGNVADVGGAARISHIIGRERARSRRVLHLDGGDCFQGAPVFNFFSGEAEIRALSSMGVDAMIVANHEFDRGALNLGSQLQSWANYPVLVANYLLEDPAQPGASPLGTVVQPYTVFDLDGLRVAVIGMGNLSSLTSIYDQPNRLGVLPLKTSEVAQFYIDLVRPNVDLVVMVSHLGLEVDERMIRDTEGIDVVLGGHNHIVLQPPKRVRDCDLVDDACAARCREQSSDKATIDGCIHRECHYIELVSAEGQDPKEPSQKLRRPCRPREVILAHSGAFAKYVGRLDVVASNLPDEIGDDYIAANGFEILTSDYRLFPINAAVPEDPIVKTVLEPYGRGLDVLANLDLLVGYAPDGSRRFSATGGDSPLGNMIATAMWLRLGIQTDFSLTNTTGIRADLVPGPVEVEQMYNIFPFDNSISKMQLSGIEVQELFDFVARRSAGRGCVSQAQIAGARVVLDCAAPSSDTSGSPGKATQIYIGVVPGQPEACSSDDQCPLEKRCVDQTCRCLDDQGCPGAAFGSCDINTGFCWQAIEPVASYELATSNYLAGGGSGFRVLQRNTTQFDTQIQQRDALIDYIRGGAPCGANASGKPLGCSTDDDCRAALGDTYVCACPEAVMDEGGACVATGTSCRFSDDPGPGDGACVLDRCREDVAQIERDLCDSAPTEAQRNECLTSLSPCAVGGEECKFLACIDVGLGNTSDNRLRMVGK